MKEEIGEVSINGTNFENINQKYILPDESEINVGEERFLAPEILFNPSLRQYEYPGLPEIITESINKKPAIGIK